MAFGMKKHSEDDIEAVIGFRDFFRIFLKVLYALRKILLSLIAFIFTMGIAISYFESLSWSDGIYLAFVSSLTVGYGDLTPHTFMGKLICIGLLPATGMLLTGIMVAGALKAIEIGNRERRDEIKLSKGE